MIVEKIREIQIKKREIIEKPPGGVVWASWLGRCPRALWYFVQGERFSNLPAAEAIVKMEEGNEHEARILRDLEAAGLLKESKKSIKMKFKNIEIHGEIDAIVSNTAGHLYVAEIKALSAYNFRKFLNFPLERQDYIRQACFYAAFERLDLIFILKNRDTGEWGERLFLLEFCEKVNQESLANLEKILEHTRPPAKAPRHPWECKYCAYFDLCGGVKKEFKTDKNLDAIIKEYEDVVSKISVLSKRRAILRSQIIAALDRLALDSYKVPGERLGIERTRAGLRLKKY